MTQQSLADQAAEALAAVADMGVNIDPASAERHHIWTLQDTAQSILANAFEQARRLAQAAEQLKKQ